MNEPYDDVVNAVQEALEEPPEGDPIAWELERLWSDLDDAKRQARNGRWSMGCDYIVHRIVMLTKHHGRAAAWGDIPFTLLLDGTYQRLHEAMGIEPEPFDVEETRRIWENYLGRKLP